MNSCRLDVCLDRRGKLANLRNIGRNWRHCDSCRPTRHATTRSTRHSHNATHVVFQTNAHADTFDEILRVVGVVRWHDGVAIHRFHFPLFARLCDDFADVIDDFLELCDLFCSCIIGESGGFCLEEVNA